MRAAQIPRSRRLPASECVRWESVVRFGAGLGVICTCTSAPRELEREREDVLRLPHGRDDVAHWGTSGQHDRTGKFLSAEWGRSRPCVFTSLRVTPALSPTCTFNSFRRRTALGDGAETSRIGSRTSLSCIEGASGQWRATVGGSAANGVAWRPGRRNVSLRLRRTEVGHQWSSLAPPRFGSTPVALVGGCRKHLAGMSLSAQGFVGRSSSSSSSRG